MKIKLDLNLRKSKGLTSIWQIDVEEVRLAPPTFQTVVSFGGPVSDAKKIDETSFEIITMYVNIEIPCADANQDDLW